MLKCIFQALFQKKKNAQLMASLEEKQVRSYQVAMIGHKRIPTQEGGVEIVVRELAKRLVTRGHHVDVYNRWDLFKKDGKVGGKFFEGVRIRQIPTLRYSKVNALIYSVLASIRALFSPYDLLHYHAIGSCVMIWMPLLCRKKIIVTVHGLDWKRAKWNKFASVYLKFGEWMAAHYAHEVIVLCQNNQRYFETTYGRHTVLIPNGMEKRTKRQAELITSKYGVGVNDYILYLARIVPEKGLHYLIDAFAQIPTSKKLIIAGAIDFEDEYTQKVFFMGEKDERVIFTGLVTGLEWEELFSNCSIYVLPSDVEGMPMSLLEAIGFGCRCVASDIDENQEAGKSAVTYFAQGDASDLQQKLQYLIDNPKEGFPTADKETWADWDSVTSMTVALYDKVLTPDYHSTARAEIRDFAEQKKRSQTKHN